MNIDNQIKEWAKITESQINEVSDVDVDWNDEQMAKDDYANLRDFTETQVNLSQREKDSIVDDVLFFLNYMHTTDFRKFIETYKSQGTLKLRELMDKYQKWSHGEKVTDMIKKSDD